MKPSSTPLLLPPPSFTTSYPREVKSGWAHEFRQAQRTQTASKVGSSGIGEHSTENHAPIMYNTDMQLPRPLHNTSLKKGQNHTIAHPDMISTPTREHLQWNIPSSQRIPIASYESVARNDVSETRLQDAMIARQFELKIQEIERTNARPQDGRLVTTPLSQQEQVEHDLMTQMTKDDVNVWYREYHYGPVPNDRISAPSYLPPPPPSEMKVNEYDYDTNDLMPNAASNPERLPPGAVMVDLSRSWDV